MDPKTCEIVCINSESNTAVGCSWFSSVQYGVYALGKAHMLSIPSLRSFPNVAFETVPMFV